MRCCDHAWSRRRWMWGSLLTTAAAVASACARSTGSAGTGSSGAPESRPDPEETTDLRAAATGLLRQHISIDVHTHAGPQGITSRAAPSDQLAHSMRRGGIAVLCLADVPDAPILGRDSRNVLRALRTPAPGQLYQCHLERLEWLDTLTTRHGIRRVLSVADLDATHRAGEPAIILDIEGLDFLEHKPERLEESYRRGVRTMQLVHYTPNDIGDFQTGAVSHGGLTPFGADVIRTCNRLGVVVDVAHATADTVTQAARVASKPLLLSHTALRGSRAQGSTPLVERQITLDHARAVAETGGSIGIWHFFKTLELYVDGLKEMVDVVGVDHVSVGTDAASATGLFSSYDRFTALVEAMLSGGFTAADTARIIGGNYRRIFAASVE